MKKGLILGFLLVSATSFADVITVQCGSKGNWGQTDQSHVFSGTIKVTTQEDEVVFGDAILSAQKGKKAQAELLTMVEMHGTQLHIPEDEAGDKNVNSVDLSNDEDAARSAFVVFNLGARGSNARLTVDHKEIYSARCVAVKRVKN